MVIIGAVGSFRPFPASWDYKYGGSRDYRILRVNEVALQELTVKPAGHWIPRHWMDPYFHLLSHCPLRGLNEILDKYVIFKLISVINGRGISYEIALTRWMPLDLTDNKSTLVQVMAWCRQATSHYLSQYWPRFMINPLYSLMGQRWANRRQVLRSRRVFQTSQFQHHGCGFDSKWANRVAFHPGTVSRLRENKC